MWRIHLLVLCALSLACNVEKPNAASRDRPDDTDAGDDGDAAPTPSARLVLDRVWSSEEIEGCVLASLLHYETKSRDDLVLAATGDGHVVAMHPKTGRHVWDVELPERADEMAYVVATPVITSDRKLVVAWQDIVVGEMDPATALRSSQRVAVVDLEQGKLDADYPILELEATKKDSAGDEIPFLTTNALSRARLVHAAIAGTKLGRVYVSFGNARDIQPWHGWLFELDLDAWKESGARAAIRSVLLTTPESDCGAAGVSGSKGMICGGGVWAPAGPTLVETGDGTFDLLVPTGNGALDLRRKHYAHTVMRVRADGLIFEDGCDANQCADWNIRAPSKACMRSCSNLFIPRPLPNDPPSASPLCDGLSHFECYATLDGGIGGSAPAVVDIPGGPRALLLPAKDGGVYLVDYEHLGTLHDRLQLVEPCGKGGANCTAFWAGMMVTKPEVVSVDGKLIAVIATFNFDDRNPAGLIGVEIAMRDGAPRLEKLWEAPSFADEPLSFRQHPSGVRIVEQAGKSYAVVVEQKGPSGNGVVYVVRAADGKIVLQHELDGPGQRFAQPLLIEDRLFMTSCVHGNRGPSHVEGWRFGR